jgi:hypothetical protein
MVLVLLTWKTQRLETLGGDNDRLVRVSPKRDSQQEEVEIAGPV